MPSKLPRNPRMSGDKAPQNALSTASPPSVVPHSWLDLSPDAFIGVDAGGRITSWSEGARALFGMPANQASGMELAALQPGQHPSLVALCLRPSSKAPARHYCQTFAGHKITVSARAEQVADGAVMLCLHQSGLSKKAQSALAEREAHLEMVMATVPDAMIEIDPKGTIQAFSAAAQRQFGYSAAEVVGKNVSMLMPEPYHAQHDQYLANYLLTGQARIIGIGRVVVGLKRDGSTFPMELTVGEVRTNERHFFIGFSRDITERQETRNRLQELQAELIHMSRFTALGEMASVLAHELNQPLAAVANYLKGGQKFLSGGKADALPMVSEALTRAMEQTLRAGEIIKNLRAFVARHETAKRAEPVVDLIEEASALALVGARSQNVHVSFDLAAALPDVMVDHVQVQQVLLNLIRNAMDAMQQSPERRLVIAARAVETDKVEISVSDTGSGIDAQVMQHLFQPFFTTKPEGMGVGLSISRTIIEAHGGRISAAAVATGGSVFRFTLPAAPRARRHVP